MYKYAGIIVDSDAIALDRIFTYEIPDKFRNSIDIGFKVKVPFGFKNSLVDGFVVKLINELESSISQVKAIKDVDYKIRLFDNTDIELINFMRNRFLCSYIDAIKTIIPSSVIKGMNNKISEVLYVNNELYGKYNKEPYISIIDTVSKQNGLLNRSQLSNIYRFSISSINTLIKHGFLSTKAKIIDRFDTRDYAHYEEKKLNDEQIKVYTSVIENDSKYFLLQGVTGSGKTEVYMHLVRKMINENKQSIILVPEISLTPQMVERFKGRFGNDITVFHSKLSDGERYDEWLRVKEGKVKVAIGARSAIFLPFKNLGLIVIDEEHESSYKSESNPKYDAREIAEFKCRQFGAKLVLGSATPSIESFYKTEKGEVTLLKIENRVDNSTLPSVEIVDMREELANNNKSIFSRILYNNIKEALTKGEQIILFLNRRGFSTFVSCRKCGYVFKCTNCDISMTYHMNNNSLTCHYCGKTQRVSSTCPKCGSSYVKYFGTGTEKVEAEVKKYFPEARVLRMDVDTTKKKNSHEEIYKAFKEGKANILIGTQMIAKGLDFPNVTLVGVLAADTSLNLPDYKAAERTFQLLTQVSGRAGRGKKEGRVIIQSYSPENYSIVFSKEHDYNGFYKKEIELRNTMNYPPFSELLLINLSSKNEMFLIKKIEELGIKIKDYIKNSDKITVLGPCPSPISKIKEFYRWQIVIKGVINQSFAYAIKQIMIDSIKDCYSEVKSSLDINPNSLL